MALLGYNLIHACNDEGIGVSGGISIFPDDSRAPADLLKIADMAMVEVKKNGKWCYARAKESFVWTAVGIIIPGNSSNTEEYDLSHYGTLKPGEYRLAVGERNACIYAYFTVNSDGSFTFPG